jgi:hypothetical protein
MPGILHGEAVTLLALLAAFTEMILLLFQDICDNMVQVNDELKKEVLSFKVHS